MIRAGKLKPLANMSEKPLNISGYGEVPPITKFYPKFPSIGSHFGLLCVAYLLSLGRGIPYYITSGAYLLITMAVFRLNIPGTPANAAAALDGFPLAQRGEAGPAIGLSATSSYIGTVFGIICLAFLTPLLQIMKAARILCTVLGNAKPMPSKPASKARSGRCSPPPFCGNIRTATSSSIAMPPLCSRRPPCLDNSPGLPIGCAQLRVQGSGFRVQEEHDRFTFGKG